ncbi:lipopolysaccharide biosynthesis protein [Peribacillus sp. TH14]|uniref:lipopolysaccharide biosynthesis protein n=1 Tax=Peribacillus sp. TH14 TaxID=2798481 RepID=UPI001913D5F5|nr:oligosaccharide flippase family protein [Peribacillus sp. TH14]MBK5500715.1 oligosaccharide flippase family protein [Peribacillus sp. TH14]
MKLKHKLRHHLINSPVIKNIFGMGFFRALGVLTNFLLMGLIYRYFSNEVLNGIWLTIFSILTWITFFDFGMGNSLRNKLTESISKNDITLSNMYISTTYILMIVPTIIIIVGATISADFIDWNKIFSVNGDLVSNEYLTLFICVVFILYALNFYFSIIFAILHAIFKSYLISGIQALVNVINIIFISVLYLMKVNDLILLGGIYIGTSVIVLVITTIWIFKLNKQNLTLSFKYFNKSLIKDIANVGLKFLILQLAIIVLFNTDNFLISRYIGVDKVTSYQLVNKLLSVNTIILGIVLTPIWTKVIRDTAENNINENRKTLFKLLIVFFLLVIGVLIIGFLSPLILKVWTGSNILVSNKLTIFMVIFTIIHMWCNIFQVILNGLSKLNIQMICYGIVAVINIPISVYLVQHTDLGVVAIILGTIFSLVVPGIILPIYTIRYFTKI